MSRTATVVYAPFPVAPLDFTSLPGTVSISPPGIVVYSATVGAPMFMFHLAGLFRNRTTCTATVDTSLRSAAGRSMAVPHTFSFTTQ